MYKNGRVGIRTAVHWGARETFRSLSYDRSTASSKAVSPECIRVLHLSMYSTSSFPAAAYVFFLALP